VTAVNGAPVTYCFEVTNTGDVHLNNVTVTDTDLDPNFSSTLGLMAPGEVVMVHHPAAINGDLLNTAGVTGDPSLPDGTLLPLPPVTDDDPARVNEVTPAIALDKRLSTTSSNGDGRLELDRRHPVAIWRRFPGRL